VNLLESGKLTEKINRTKAGFNSFFALIARHWEALLRSLSFLRPEGLRMAERSFAEDDRSLLCRLVFVNLYFRGGLKI
jgi:hypothetical protein